MKHREERIKQHRKEHYRQVQSGEKVYPAYNLIYRGKGEKKME